MNKRENVVTKFHGFWEDLSNEERKQLWDLFTALRGEDKGSRTLKRMTTCRIRAFVFPKEYHSDICGWVYPTLERAKCASLIGETRLPRLKKLYYQESGCHWRGHTKKAMQILRKLFPSKTKEFEKFLRFA